MALRFEETLLGHLETAEGLRPFSFRVRVAGPSFWGAWGRDFLALVGSASLDGAALEAPLEPGSTLRIGLPFARSLTYHLAFRDVEGRRYRFFGTKRVRWTRLPRTLRRLVGTVYRDGEVLGPATLWFRWRDLPAFLASWRVAAGVDEA